MDTARIQIATVGTQQATQQTKTLKQQIKELREELAGLTRGTEEYNQKSIELGNVMHQQQEIMEDAKYATQDYGSTLSNLTRIGAGVAGSFAAVQGVMNLMGANNEDAQKTIQTMTSMLGVIQGLTALDEARKSFEGLWKKIKNATTATREHTVSMEQNSTAAKTDAANLTTAATATKAQGTAAGTATKMTNGLSFSFKALGKSIKSFMMSNPFTLIILGATTLISVITNLISKTKEEAEELRNMQKEASDAINEQNKAYNGSTAITENTKRSVGEYYYKKAPVIKNGGRYWLNPREDNPERVQLEKDIAALSLELEKLEEQDLKYTETYENKYNEYLAKEKQLVYGQITWYEMAKKNAQEKLAVDKDDADALADQANAVQNLETLYLNYYGIVKNGENYVQEYIKKQEADDEKDKQKRETDWEKQKQKDLQKLKDKLTLELLYNERAYKANEISLEEYNDKAKEIREQHLVDYDKWAKKYRVKEADTKLYREQTNDQIIANERATLEEILRIRELENDPTNAINARNAQQSVEQAKQAAEARKKNEDAILEQSVEYAEKANELYNASMLRKMILIEKWGKAELDAQHQIEMQVLNDQMEAQREQEQQLEQSYQQQIADQEAITQAKSDALDEQYTNGLMSEQEYLEAIEQLWIEHYIKLDEMEAEHITNRAEIQEQQADTMLEIQQKEFDYEKAKWEERKTLVQNYYSAFTQIVSGIQGLLTELQGAYKEDSKEYENIAEANIIISGIMGALEAFQSAMSLGFPYNIIIGGIMSGISIATTAAALSNLKSKKLSSSAQKASVSINPYEVVSTETGAELNGSIQDTKVYVTEQDITDTQNRVNVAESESTF